MPRTIKPHLWIAVLVYGDDHAHLTVIIGADRPAVLVASTPAALVVLNFLALLSLRC